MCAVDGLLTVPSGGKISGEEKISDTNDIVGRSLFIIADARARGKNSEECVACAYENTC